MDFSKFPILRLEDEQWLLESFSKEQKIDWPEGLGELKDMAIMIMQRKVDELGITEDNLQFATMQRLMRDSEELYVVLARFYRNGDKKRPVTVKMPFDLTKTPTGFKLTVEHFNPEF